MGDANNIIDTRVCKIPAAYDGERKNWKHFKLQLNGYVGGVSMTLKNMMKICEGIEVKIDAAAFGLTEEQIQLSAKLWTILSSCLKDKAMDMMCNTPENNGLEVYRKMSRRGLIRTAGHDGGVLCN